MLSWESARGSWYPEGQHDGVTVPIVLNRAIFRNGFTMKSSCRETALPRQQEDVAVPRGSVPGRTYLLVFCFQDADCYCLLLFIVRKVGFPLIIMAFKIHLLSAECVE